jgi:hypothetical protein
MLKWGLVKGAIRGASVASFYLDCAKWARKGCVEAANDWQWIWGIPIVSGLVGLAAWYRPGETITTGWPILDGFLSAAAAFVVTWLVIFFTQLVRAPAKLYAGLEARTADEIKTLKLALFDKEARQKALAELWKLREQGVALRNETVTPAGYANWKQRFGDWQKTVLGDAETISLSFKAWLETLDRIRPPVAAPSPACNQEHNLLRNVQGEMLLRMQEFLQAEMLRTDLKDLVPYT